MHLPKPLFLVSLACLISLSYCPWAICAGESTPLHDRDWKLHPAIVELPAPQVLYALGDVHGDCDRMLQTLAAARLIDSASATPKNIQWTGGTADLVLTGDEIDKYNQNIRVIGVLRALEPQAEKAGGHLVVCLGNHEADFLASSPDDKKGTEFINELKTAGISAVDVAAGRDAGGIGTWLRNLPAGAKIADWFFCHAGNTGGKKVADLSLELENDLSTLGYSTPLLIDPNSMLKARMHPRPWFEATSDPSLHEVKEPKDTGKQPSTAESNKRRTGDEIPPKLLETIQALGVSHLVIGHQPGKVTFADGEVRPEGEMFAHYAGAFFMIDTGMSRGASNGHSAVLRIEFPSQNVSAVYADGKTSVLWERSRSH